MRRNRPRPEAGATHAYLNKSIEQLEGSSWGDPDCGSYVVRTAHALRKKPLQTLSDEELRLALTQNNGFPWVLELAVRRLEEDPLRSGDFYRGDVLVSALRPPYDAWSSQPGLRARMAAVAATVKARLDDLDEGDQQQLRPVLDAFLVF